MFQGTFAIQLNDVTSAPSTRNNMQGIDTPLQPATADEAEPSLDQLYQAETAIIRGWVTDAIQGGKMKTLHFSETLLFSETCKNTPRGSFHAYFNGTAKIKFGVVKMIIILTPSTRADHFEVIKKHPSWHQSSLELMTSPLTGSVCP